LIAAMESGVLKPGETIYDAGRFTKYDGFAPTCLAWAYGVQHGNVDAPYALEESCNYFFYELGDRLAIEALDKTAKKLGLGEPTGVELEENLGQRANPENKASLFEGFDGGWFMGDQILAAIGQSINRFTPMQLCVYATTLANHGTRYKATFMNRVVSADYQSLLAENKPTVMDRLEISQATIDAYTEGMIRVTQAGTAETQFRGYPLEVAGKTGTAEEHIGSSDNGAFICFAPADDPQIAIAIYIEKGGHGATISSVSQAIMDEYFDVDEIGEVVTYENLLT